MQSPISAGGTGLTSESGARNPCALNNTSGRWCWGTRTRMQLGDGFNAWEPIEFAPPTFE